MHIFGVLVFNVCVCVCVCVCAHACTHARPFQLSKTLIFMKFGMYLYHHRPSEHCSIFSFFAVGSNNTWNINVWWK
jgi:hypothetical protein